MMFRNRVPISNQLISTHPQDSHIREEDGYGQFSYAIPFLETYAVSTCREDVMVSEVSIRRTPY